MGMSRDFESSANPEAVALIIPDSATVSNAIACAGFSWARFYFASGFEGTVFYIEVTEDDPGDSPTWYDMHDETNTEVSMTPTAGDSIRVDGLLARHFRLVADAQTGAYTVPYHLSG